MEKFEEKTEKMQGKLVPVDFVIFFFFLENSDQLHGFFLFLRLSDTVFFCIFQLQKLFIRFRYLVRIKKEAAVTLPVL